MKKFIIHGLDDITGAPGNDGYELQLNPESIKRNRAITMGDKKGVDVAGEVVQYVGYGEQTLDLDFFVDGTGAIPSDRGDSYGSKAVTSVDADLQELESKIYTFDGNIHKP